MPGTRSTAADLPERQAQHSQGAAEDVLEQLGCQVKKPSFLQFAREEVPLRRSMRNRSPSLLSLSLSQARVPVAGWWGPGHHSRRRSRYWASTLRGRGNCFICQTASAANRGGAFETTGGHPVGAGWCGAAATIALAVPAPCPCGRWHTRCRIYPRPGGKRVCRRGGCHFADCCSCQRRVHVATLSWSSQIAPIPVY